MTLAGQWAHVVHAWPGLLAAAFARQDPADPQRWCLLDGLSRATAAIPPLDPRRTSGTTAALGLLEDRARHGDPGLAPITLSAVRAARPDLLGGPAPSPPTGPIDEAKADAWADGTAVVALVVDGAEDPPTSAPPGVGLDLWLRLDAIRAERPWPENPVFQHLIAGAYRPEQVAVFLDQWQLHLHTGPSLFAAILGNLPPGHPDRGRLASDLVARGDGSAPDRRTYLAGELRRLRVAMTGQIGPQPIRPLTETRGHLGLMRSITRGRSPEQAMAAVSAVKPGFAATCARIARALVTEYHVDDADVGFFVHQAARNDTGDDERKAIERIAGRDQATDDAIAAAFADGQASYHLILDGCHRAALAQAPA